MDGLTSEVLQYQFTFYLSWFRDTDEKKQKKTRDCVTPTAPPPGVYLHINFKTQTHLS